jgi:hypothetical protein
MKYLAIAIFVTGSLGAALSAAAPLESLDAYNGIVQNNIFDPNRSGFRPAVASGAATEVPAAPPVVVTLVGVAVLHGETTAVFASATPDLAGSRRAGERLGEWSLTAVTLNDVTLKTATAEFHLAVGRALVKSADATWQVGSAPLSTASPSVTPYLSAPGTVAGTGAAVAISTQAGASETPAATGSSPEEILRRMRERRQKELNP